MALSPKLSNEAANAAADAVCALCNGGFFDLYDGAQPANANTAITTQVKLAHLTFASPAFAAAVNGVATANAIGSDASADATGTAAWFRAYKANGTSPAFDGSVGTSGCDLNLSSVSIIAGGAISISSFTYTQAKG